MSIYVHIQDKVISFFFNNMLVVQSDQNLLNASKSDTSS